MLELLNSIWSTFVNMREHFPIRLQNSARSFALLSTRIPTAGVVFVHGFRGDPSTTWIDFEHLIEELDKFRNIWSRCDIFFYGYTSHSQIVPLSESFLEFLKNVAARNENNLAKSEFPLPSMTQNPPAIPKELGRARGATRYRHIVVVGHSTGAVIIREAILLHLRRVRKKTEDLTAWIAEEKASTTSDLDDQLIAKASLRFFAPAHLGVLAAGKLGFARSVPIVRTIVDGYLRCNPLYQNLNPASPTILDIRRETEELYKEHKIEALRASSLFGDEEEIVTIGGYRHDEDPPTESKQNHTSVCKPNRTYLKPLEFVTDGQKFAQPA